MPHPLADMGVPGHLLGDELEITKWYVNRGYLDFCRRRNIDPRMGSWANMVWDAEKLSASQRAARRVARVLGEEVEDETLLPG